METYVHNPQEGIYWAFRKMDAYSGKYGESLTNGSKGIPFSLSSVSHLPQLA